MNLDSLLAELRSLSSEDLRTVEKHCKVLLAMGPGPKAHNSAHKPDAGGAFDEMLYDAICAELRKRVGTFTSSPYAIFKKGHVFEKFKEAVELAAHINKLWYPQQTKREQASMVVLYADLIIDYLTHVGWDWTWQSISAAVKQLPLVVDTFFPGYIAAGLLDRIQDLRTRPNKIQQ